MRFTIATVLTLAMAVAAIPQREGGQQGGQREGGEHKQKASIQEAQCVNGAISCCLNTNEHENKGLLAGLLAEGLVSNLIGNRDSSCAKLDVLDDIAVLAMTKKEEHGTVCKNIMACCPHSGGECNAIGSD
ncbi:hypothetical protein FE257_002703 [Aspergillus nanangensis]|uniref:Hydrophobin n=1 Tax=Aspergillus nanangensis TaxID=2582783 RepID=A0AAD4CCB4_ASPNN|nr:hypothetical protein FE257_002703 [Aspergillus nanangensis]